MTFAYYANKAGKDLTGQKMLDALESGDKFLRYLQLSADQVLQDRSPRQHRDAGSADPEGPLGADEG